MLEEPLGPNLTGAYSGDFGAMQQAVSSLVFFLKVSGSALLLLRCLQFGSCHSRYLALAKRLWDLGTGPGKASCLPVQQPPDVLLFSLAAILLPLALKVTKTSTAVQCSYCPPREPV